MLVEVGPLQETGQKDDVIVCWAEEAIHIIWHVTPSAQKHTNLQLHVQWSSPAYSELSYMVFAYSEQIFVSLGVTVWYKLTLLYSEFPLTVNNFPLWLEFIIRGIHRILNWTLN